MEHTDPNGLEAGRVLFASECRFVAAADRPARMPPPLGPEVGFAGRSNVGKSSLLNALTGRAALARVSRTPGRTRELIFFNLAEKLMLVDMPGYGYAKAPKKLAREWQGLMLAYLRGRTNLRRVLLLLDARRPATEADEAVMALLDRAAVTFQIVLTKTDTLCAEELAVQAAAAARLARAHPAAHPEIIATSSRRATGIAELKAELALLAS
ncbi:MAG: ribosome biogenesis GTP-binding protein YihA/YsxC [Rhodospirillales bacterium]|nr:ribosome biogenesis GTP-binding protein YihA/YsxC [Rhodospirillales bacterium]